MCQATSLTLMNISRGHWSMSRWEVLGPGDLFPFLGCRGDNQRKQNRPPFQVMAMFLTAPPSAGLIYYFHSTTASSLFCVLFIPVINTKSSPKATWTRKGLFPLKPYVMRGSQGRNSGAGHMSACFPYVLGLSLQMTDHLELGTTSRVSSICWIGRVTKGVRAYSQMVPCFVYLAVYRSFWTFHCIYFDSC